MSEDNQGTEQTADILREQISLRAYQLWQERGCPIGSAEEDWLRAEEGLRLQAARPAVGKKHPKIRSYFKAPLNHLL